MTTKTLLDYIDRATLQDLYHNKKLTLRGIAKILLEQHGRVFAPASISRIVEPARTTLETNKNRHIRNQDFQKGVFASQEWEKRDIKSAESWAKRKNPAIPLRNPKTKKYNIPEPYYSKIRQVCREKITLKDFLVQLTPDAARFSKFEMQECEPSQRKYSKERMLLFGKIDELLISIIHKPKHQIF